MDSIHVLLHEFMPYIGTLSTQKLSLHCAKVGGGMDQGPATQLTHLGLNQPFSFCSVCHTYFLTEHARTRLQTCIKGVDQMGVDQMGRHH